MIYGVPAALAPRCGSQMTTKKSRIDVRKLDTKTVVTISGTIDEHLELSRIEQLEFDALEFNLKDVRRLNSE